MKAETPTAVVPPCYGPDIPSANLAILAEMRVREAQSRTRAIAAGQLLMAPQFCRKLGITEQSLAAAVEDGRMFNVNGPDGIKVYPAFLASAGNHRGDFEKVSLALEPLHGDIKWGFFNGRYISLQGETPVEALLKGRLGDVLNTASGFLHS